MPKREPKRRSRSMALSPVPGLQVGLAIPLGKPGNWVDPQCDFDSELERDFALLWVSLYPDLDLRHHYRGIPGRRFEFDFVALPINLKVAIEIHGGTRKAGTGHNTGSGIQRDVEKKRLAQQHGWVVMELTGEDSRDAEALAQVADVIQQRKELLERLEQLNCDDY